MLIGSYFGTHFMMAGEKFENMNPERFLFGENSDLNYLPSKPTPVGFGNHNFIFFHDCYQKGQQ